MSWPVGSATTTAARSSRPSHNSSPELALGSSLSRIVVGERSFRRRLEGPPELIRAVMLAGIQRGVGGRQGDEDVGSPVSPAQPDCGDVQSRYLQHREFVVADSYVVFVL